MTELAPLIEPSGKRAQSKAANRRAILDAARQVFARIGYDATSVRDIIRETDLAAGTFYNYFKSKEEVFEAIADDSVARFRPALSAVRESATSFDDFVTGAYRAFFEFVAEDCTIAPANGEVTTVGLGHRVDTPEMKAVFDEIRTHFEALVARGEAPPVDAEYLTAAAVGIAREVGDHMLSRRPVETGPATAFASAMLIAGLKAVPTTD